jgi:hypothetical protein
MRGSLTPVSRFHGGTLPAVRDHGTYSVRRSDILPNVRSLERRRGGHQSSHGGVSDYSSARVLQYATGEGPDV